MIESKKRQFDENIKKFKKLNKKNIKLNKKIIKNYKKKKWENLQRKNVRKNCGKCTKECLFLFSLFRQNLLYGKTYTIKHSENGKNKFNLPRYIKR